MDASDHDLLRRYANESSQEAFAELVRRHVDPVVQSFRAAKNARGRLRKYSQPWVLR